MAQYGRAGAIPSANVGGQRKLAERFVQIQAVEHGRSPLSVDELRF
jgi:hypothetical protein